MATSGVAALPNQEQMEEDASELKFSKGKVAGVRGNVNWELISILSFLTIDRNSVVAL